MPESVSVVVE
jgi:hypothetical protein